jgi:hypothetical protein
LQLVLGSVKTPARERLDIWPTLPLIILCKIDYPTEIVDNIVAALERCKACNRVRRIILRGVSSSHLGDFSAVMQDPFPELTSLELESDDEIDETVPVLTDSFLGAWRVSLPASMPLYSTP